MEISRVGKIVGLGLLAYVALVVVFETLLGVLQPDTGDTIAYELPDRGVSAQLESGVRSPGCTPAVTIEGSLNADKIGGFPFRGCCLADRQADRHLEIGAFGHVQVEETQYAGLPIPQRVVRRVHILARPGEVPAYTPNRLRLIWVRIGR